MRQKIGENLWVGDHGEKPYAEEVDVVITLGHPAGTVDDGVKHYTYGDAVRPEGEDAFLDALMTLDAQWGDHQRRVLVRATGQSAYVWPSFLIANLLCDYGATPTEALATACPTPEFMREDQGAAPLRNRLLTS